MAFCAERAVTTSGAPLLSPWHEGSAGGLGTGRGPSDVSSLQGAPGIDGRQGPVAQRGRPLTATYEVKLVRPAGIRRWRHERAWQASAPELPCCVRGPSGSQLKALTNRVCEPSRRRSRSGSTCVQGVGRSFGYCDGNNASMSPFLLQRKSLRQGLSSRVTSVRDGRARRSPAARSGRSRNRQGCELKDQLRCQCAAASPPFPAGRASAGE